MINKRGVVWISSLCCSMEPLLSCVCLCIDPSLVGLLWQSLKRREREGKGRREGEREGGQG